MSVSLYCAPMEGVTGTAFRRAHAAVFGGVDRYFAPFFSPTQEHVMPPRVKRELLPGNNPGFELVPQLLCRDADDFVWAARLLFDMGYGEVNFNLGCPSGTVAAKGKGAGFLARPDELDAFFGRVFSALPGARISVKTRLGVEDEAEFGRLLDIYARYPICELTVHARVRRDMYRLPVRPGGYALACERLSAPLCYNGDVFTPEDARRVTERFPVTHALMLGRGLMANPALAREIQGGAPASREELLRFHDMVYAGCARDFGSENVTVPRMKELWSYLRHSFEPCPREYKRLAKSRRPDEYLASAHDILNRVPLRPGGRFEVD